MNIQRTYQREYMAWLSAKTRCYNQRAPQFRLYGGRGIVVCDEWRHDFMRFYRDIGPRPAGTSLDRIDVNGPYAPNNCRWATAREQGNNRRTNRVIEFRGVRMTMQEWADRLGIRKTALHQRIAGMSWPIERALTEPLNQRRK